MIKPWKSSYVASLHLRVLKNICDLEEIRGALLNKGDGSVILDKVQKKDGLTIAEVFVQLKPDHQEIHLNTEMLLKSKAILGADYKACPNAEYLEMAVEIEK